MRGIAFAMAVLYDLFNIEQTQIRFAVRQKRADTKRALKDYLLYGKSSKPLSQVC